MIVDFYRYVLNLFLGLFTYDYNNNLLAFVSVCLIGLTIFVYFKKCYL